MKKYIGPLLSVAVAAFALFAAGCASAPSKFYTLSAAAAADDTPAVPCAIVVGPVTVPTLVDRPQFTLQVTPNRVEQDEFNRWAEPLNENIARVVAYNLSVLLGTTDVATTTRASMKPGYQVAINLERFDSVPGKSAKIDAQWTVQKLPAGTMISGHTAGEEPVKGNDPEALAKAHSQALAKLSRDIAASIRADAGEKP